MPTIDINDTTLFYEISGQGPAVLFIHGMCGHADVWADQAERFADRFTCVRYDRRGHSRSNRGSAPISTAQHAADTAALIETLGLAPCLVVGSSAGAVIAIEVGLRHRGLLRGAVFSEPPLFSLDPETAGAFLGELAPLAEAAIAEGGPRAGVDAFMSFVCTEAWSTLDKERKDRLRENADIGFTDLQSPPLDVTAAELATLDVPALVLAGTTSHPVFRSVAHRLAAALPDARIVEIDGGHVPYIEHPQAFAHTIEVFATELAQRDLVRP